ncbi:MAG: polymer-forming cytoskeletal protein [Pseudomonadota bacterium]|nr:polymer-forming cytoskeletal protein [Pseudomonadota bacterium]
MFGKDKEDVAAQNGAPPSAARPAAGGGDAPSIISADMKVVGNLNSDGDIQIDGTVEGDIKSRTVTVGESANISGSISASSVNVRGRVSGKIIADAVRIAKTANVQGDIGYKTLAIEEQAVLDGKVRRMDAAKPVAQAAKPAADDGKVEPLKTAQAGGGASGGTGGGAQANAKPGVGGKPLAS